MKKNYCDICRKEIVGKPYKLHITDSCTSLDDMMVQLVKEDKLSNVEDFLELIFTMLSNETSYCLECIEEINDYINAMRTNNLPRDTCSCNGDCKKNGECSCEKAKEDEAEELDRYLKGIKNVILSAPSSENPNKYTPLNISGLEEIFKSMFN